MEKLMLISLGLLILSLITNKWLAKRNPFAVLAFSTSSITHCGRSPSYTYPSSGESDSAGQTKNEGSTPPGTDEKDQPLKEKMAKIQKAPRKRPTSVQPATERKRRIKGWIELLRQLPYSQIAKTPHETESMYVRDNPEEFSNVLLVCQIEYNIDHPEAYVIMYCCFMDDGTFKIKGEYPNYSEKIMAIIETYPGAQSLIDHDDETTKTWTQGYKLMIKMLKKAFSTSIPEPPQAK